MVVETVKCHWTFSGLLIQNLSGAFWALRVSIPTIPGCERHATVTCHALPVRSQ